MRIVLSLLVALSLLLFIACLYFAPSLADEVTVPLHVVGQKGSEIWVRPYVAGTFGLVVVKGEIPYLNEVIRCSEGVEERVRGEQRFSAIVLTCEKGLRMEMRDVDIVH